MPKLYQMFLLLLQLCVTVRLNAADANAQKESPEEAMKKILELTAKIQKQGYDEKYDSVFQDAIQKINKETDLRTRELEIYLSDLKQEMTTAQDKVKLIETEQGDNNPESPAKMHQLQTKLQSLDDHYTTLKSRLDLAKSLRAVSKDLEGHRVSMGTGKPSNEAESMKHLETAGKVLRRLTPLLQDALKMAQKDGLLGDTTGSNSTDSKNGTENIQLEAGKIQEQIDAAMKKLAKMGAKLPQPLNFSDSNISEPPIPTADDLKHEPLPEGTTKLMIPGKEEVDKIREELRNLLYGDEAAANDAEQVPDIDIELQESSEIVGVGTEAPSPGDEDGSQQEVTSGFELVTDLDHIGAPPAEDLENNVEAQHASLPGMEIVPGQQVDISPEVCQPSNLDAPEKGSEAYKVAVHLGLQPAEDDELPAETQRRQVLEEDSEANQEPIGFEILPGEPVDSCGTPPQALGKDIEDQDQLQAIAAGHDETEKRSTVSRSKPTKTCNAADNKPEDKSEPSTCNSVQDEAERDSTVSRPNAPSSETCSAIQDEPEGDSSCREAQDEPDTDSEAQSEPETSESANDVPAQDAKAASVPESGESTPDVLPRTLIEVQDDPETVVEVEDGPEAVVEVLDGPETLIEVHDHDRPKTDAAQAESDEDDDFDDSDFHERGYKIQEIPDSESDAYYDPSSTTTYYGDNVEVVQAMESSDFPEDEDIQEYEYD